MTYAGVANPVVPIVIRLVTCIVRLSVTQMVTHAAVLTCPLQEVYINDRTGYTCVLSTVLMHACAKEGTRKCSIEGLTEWLLYLLPRPL